MSYKLSKRSLNNLKGVDERLVNLLNKAICNSPYDFGIPNSGGKRTALQQHKLFLDGKSQLDGFKKKSYHQSGEAFDIYLYINKKASWDINKLEEIAIYFKDLAKKVFDLGLIWGGDWNNNGIRVDKDRQERFLDGGHFQIKR